MSTKLPITVGVSACLLGEKVRYDGGHKHDHYITDVLGNYFDFVPVCPEVECGMSIPREAMRLEGDPENPSLFTNKTHIDKTEQMQSFCNRKVIELEKHNLSGFIFKKDSPSSGLFRVKLYNNNMAARTTSGLFAAAVVKHFPLLPVEEEGRLNDAILRENFIERVFAYQNWKDFLSTGPKLGDLVDFHTKYKYLIMAHSNTSYKEMGAFVANGKTVKLPELLSKYEELFMQAFSEKATVKKNCNVLMHIMGYFKRELSHEEKEEMLGLINDYSEHQAPLIVPITMLKHYIKKYNQTYLLNQIYLTPHPAKLMLRNHV